MSAEKHVLVLDYPSCIPCSLWWIPASHVGQALEAIVDLRSRGRGFGFRGVALLLFLEVIA